MARGNGSRKIFLPGVLVGELPDVVDEVVDEDFVVVVVVEDLVVVVVVDEVEDPGRHCE